jgi:alpha-tubulin suppressor-like RCC1 family protein
MGKFVFSLLLICGLTLPSTGNCQCWQSLTSGGFFSLAIKNDGTLWAWGSNQYGQLGDGTLIDKYTPIQIGVGNNWASISAGYHHSVAIKTDGTLWAWGQNTSGQLGDGTLINKNIPVQIGSATNWLNASPGLYHSLALTVNNELWAWGNNLSGELGDGTFITKTIPTQIGNAVDWFKINGGGYHSLAIKNDGSVWSWGINLEGQQAISPIFFGPVNTPTQILSGVWTDIASGVFHCMAVKNDGTLWAWGSNLYGQFGDGTNTDSFIPVQIPGVSNWSKISAGYQHSLGLRNDGSMWSWGRNPAGELGNGTNTDSNIPVSLGVGSLWTSISASFLRSVNLKNDNSIWACGANGAGNLGNGLLLNSNILNLVNCSGLPLTTYDSICSNTLPYLWNGQNYQSSGVYTYTTPLNVVDTLYLTVILPQTSIDSLSACDSYTWIDGVTYNTSNNTAVFVTTNNLGCDSVIHLDLTLNFSSSTSVNVSTAVFPYIFNGDTLLSPGIYTFTEESADGCNLITTLTLTSTIEIEDDPSATFSLYPNPFNDNLAVNVTMGDLGKSFFIRDSAGRTVKSGVIQTLSNTFELQNLTDGVYFFSIDSNSNPRRIVKISDK